MMDDMTTPQNSPALVAGCSRDHKPHLLRVCGWDMDQTKLSTNISNTFFSKMVGWKIGWDILIDNWDWLLIGREGVSAGSKYHGSKLWSQLHRLWLPMMWKVQVASCSVWNILAYVLYIGRKWRGVVNLYI